MIMCVSVMKYSYDNVQCSIKLHGNLIDLLKQGCALSPLLFNLYKDIRLA